MKPIIIKIITISLLSFYFFSCKENTKNKEKTEVNAVNMVWKGKKIIFPSSLKRLSDSLQKPKNNKYTIVAFYDGHCSICYSELNKWKTVMKDYKKRNFNNVNFKFILSGNNKPDVEFNLINMNFPLHQVLYDSKEEFNGNYKFTTEYRYKYSSMLLNENNIILYVGNPTNSEKDENEFIKRIKQI